MRIPDGDLVPARRHRYGGGYARRRRRRMRRFAVIGVLILAGVTAAYWVSRGPVPATSAAKGCPSPSPTPAVTLPDPRQVRLSLLNGTTRNGLAQQIATALTQRGFVVVTHDTAPALVPGASRISYGPGGQPAATVLARYVVGAQLVPAPNAPRGSVQLVLGSAFVRLATDAEVAAAATPPPAVAASPLSGSCRA